MVCVFGSFVIGDPLRILAVFVPGLAPRSSSTPTVVCMVLVPAVMQLLWPANSWLPRWVARATPNLTIEPGTFGDRGTQGQPTACGLDGAPPTLSAGTGAADTAVAVVAHMPQKGR